MSAVIRYPKLIVAQGVRDDVIRLTDLMPTVLDILGYKIPEEVEGKSFKNVLIGPEGKVETVWPVVSYTVPPDGGSFKVAVRTRDWKYLIDFATGVEEFYHVSEDPWELKNLVDSDEYAGLLDEHRKELEKWMTEVKPVMNAERKNENPEDIQRLKDLGYVK